MRNYESLTADEAYRLMMAEAAKGNLFVINRNRNGYFLLPVSQFRATAFDLLRG